MEMVYAIREDIEGVSNESSPLKTLTLKDTQMLVPISWLKKYVPVTDSPHELGHKLTMAGIEIGEVRVIGGDWDREKVVVGHVLRVDPHPERRPTHPAHRGYG